MIKNILVGVACLLACFCSLTQELKAASLLKESGGNLISNYSEDRIRHTVQAYLQLIDSISQGENISYKDMATTVLAPNCKKIWNGVVSNQNRDEIIADLQNVYATVGPWKITPVDIIISPKENTAVLRLMVKVANAGNFTTIVILRLDANDLVKEINEVFNNVDGNYHFEGANG